MLPFSLLNIFSQLSWNELIGHSLFLSIFGVIIFFTPSKPPDDDSITSNPEVTEPAQVQRSNEEPQACLSGILRTNELLRYLDDYAFKEFVQLVEERSYQKGDSILDIEEFEFCIVGQGEVEVWLDMAAPGDDNNEKRLFHTKRARGSLLPMSTFLEFLVKPQMDATSMRDEKRDLRNSSSFHILPHLEFLAVEDVVLYVVPRSVLRAWMSQQESRSILHIIQETLRRYYSVIFPICTTYFGFDDQVATCFGTSQNLSSPLDQASFMNTESTSHWIKQALETIGERGSIKEIMINLSDEMLTSPVSSTQTISDTMQQQFTQPSYRGQKHSAERGSQLRENPRRPISLSLQTSSFGQQQGDPLRPSVGTSLASLTETQKNQQNKSVTERCARKRFIQLSSHIKVGMAREIMKVMGCERSLTEYLGSHSKSEDLGTFKGPILSAHENSTRSASNELEALVQEYAKFIKLLYYAQDAVVAQKDQEYPGVIYVVNGSLGFKSVPVGRVNDQKKGKFLRARIEPGNIIGSESILPNTRGLFEIVAREESFVGVLPREKIFELGNRFPKLFFLMGERLLAALPDGLKLADYAMNWNQLRVGQMVDPQIANRSLAIVLKGRIRIKQPIPGTNDFNTMDVGIGGTVGSPYSFYAERSPHEMSCIRKSELVDIQLPAFETLALMEPRILLSLSKLIAANAAASGSEDVRQNIALEKPFFKPRTIALLALSSNVPVELFTDQLLKAIIDTRIYPSHDISVLYADTIIEALGGDVFNNAGNVRLESYVTRVEENFGLTLMVGDLSPHSTWNRTCITHADSIILLAMADDPPSLSQMDKALMSVGSRSDLHLVLLHEDTRLCRGGLTSDWLQQRPWITGGHHHVLMTKDGQKTAHAMPSPLLQNSADFQRLARRLFGRSIALVLGGGGARGAAHLGFMRAMEERGIPIDIVGGSSMGACVGGVFAKTLSVKSTLERINALSGQMRLDNFLSDLTYPHIAKTTGTVFQREIRNVFGDLNLDDLWLEYYCAVTNITKNCISQMQFDGNTATSIAASMSYSGLVPPTCMKGDMLVDGCYSCNLPIRRARVLGAELILVVDVSALEPLAPQYFGSTLSGWTVLYRKLKNQFNGKGGEDTSKLPPSLSVVLDRLTQSTSLMELEFIKNTPGCHYIPLPVNHYSAKDPSKFDELVDIGYQTGKAWFEEMEASHKLRDLAVP